MTSITRILTLMIFASLFACTPGRQLTQIKDQANEAYIAGDYGKALTLYEEIIIKQKEGGELADGESLKRAGISAWETGNTTKALEHLEAAKHTQAANSQTFAILAQAYRSIDNLSREITNLEEYINRFPEGDKSREFGQRLFITYVESMNWDKAVSLWQSIDSEDQQKEDLLNGYFTVQKNLGNESNADELAKELLRKNDNNVNALKWLAEKHYWLAENRYQSEMKAYENNRTNRQYARLLEAFEILNTDFRISLNYFLRLYKTDPSPAVARFIGNIYMRFDDKKKADIYFNKAK